jgi:hypothetical protein
MSNINAYDYPIVTLKQLQPHLGDPYPVWFLSPRGEVAATNLLSMWLWSASELSDLLGVNAFNVFTRNLKRIPKDKNCEFFAKKSAVVKRLCEVFGTKSYLAFISAMKSDPYLREIFDWELELSKEEWEFDREWKYPLRLQYSDAYTPAVLMEFRVTVSRLEGDLGYLAIYEPDPGSKITQSLVEHEYRRLITHSREQPYIQYLNFTELLVEMGIRSRAVQEDADLEEAMSFDVAFQEKFREAMLAMTRTPEYHEALACFHATYAYRKSFPWLPESSDTRDEINQDGLSYALRAALSTYIVPEASTLKDMDAFIKPQDFYVEDWKRFEAGWVSALVSAVNATISEGFSLKRFENQLSTAGIDVSDISPATLRIHIAAALVRYYNRRNMGISRDPL